MHAFAALLAAMLMLIYELDWPFVIRCTWYSRL